jgi:hypothetical protein
MVAKLTKQTDQITMTFEVFDLELDAPSQKDMAADPAGFLRKAIADAGAAPPNRIVVDDRIKDEVGDGGVTDPPRPRVFHCVSPAEHASTYITIVM